MKSLSTEYSNISIKYSKYFSNKCILNIVNIIVNKEGKYTVIFTKNYNIQIFILVI